MTPHIHPGRYENTRSTIEKAFKDFRLALRKARVALHIGMAAEVRVSPDIVALLSQNEVPFLGELDGHRIILLEFPHTQITPGADKLIERLLQHNIRPLIAHPERNQDVMRDLSKIEPFIEMGCFLKNGSIFERSRIDRKSTRLNSSHRTISYAVFCLKKKK